MLCGLDAIPLTEEKTGVGHYTQELARAVAAAAPADDFRLLYPSAYEPLRDPAGAWPPNLRPERVQVGPVGRHWWSAGLPAYARRAGLELFHGTNYDVPLWGVPATVLTVHDLSTHLHPETHEARRVRRWRRRLPLMLRAATLVITPTESVRREVCEHMDVRPDKVFAVPEAARAVFRPAAAEEAAEVRRRLGVADDFLLAVGTLEPRKNLAALVLAFEEMARRGGAGSRLQLVIAGRRGWLNRELFARAGHWAVRDRIRFTGYVTDEELRALYSSCRAFVYPSLYEGFGLPPLEAMACGAPVIASRIPAHEETTGGAALLVPPADVTALGQAVERVLTDRGLAESLSAAGRERASRFSWESAARLTRDLYAEAAARAGRR